MGTHLLLQVEAAIQYLFDNGSIALDNEENKGRNGLPIRYCEMFVAVHGRPFCLR